MSKIFSLPTVRLGLKTFSIIGEDVANGPLEWEVKPTCGSILIGIVTIESEYWI